jgi:soluble lytic murein transglycosylase-like protein
MVLILLSAWSTGYNQQRSNYQKYMIEANKTVDRLDSQLKVKDQKIDDLQKQLKDLEEQDKQLKKTLGLYSDLSKQTGLSIEAIALTYKLAKEYDPELHLGLMSLESNFKTDLVHANSNGSHDYGLCQLNDGGTAQWLWSQVYPKKKFDKDKLLDPLVNIHLSAHYLNGIFSKYDGDPYKALTHYNKGPGGLKKYIRIHGTAKSAYSRGVISRGGDIRRSIKS